MNRTAHRGTLLDIPLLEEKYGAPMLASAAIHVTAVLFFLVAPFLLPGSAPIQLGTGPGGGSGGEAYAVGVTNELGGGAGMVKPALIPQPPALPAEKARKEENPDAIPIPDTIAPKKLRPKAQSKDTPDARKQEPVAGSNAIPTTARPGAGGTGGLGGGTGGGRGGGNGVMIGAGSGGNADSWYARVVEARVSSNWIRPGEGVRVEITYSFFIATDGSIYNITREKSCGVEVLDQAAERAIRASNPLAPPPPEFRGRPLQFVAQFVYPPNP